LRRLCRKYPVLRERVEEIGRDLSQNDSEASLETLTDDLSEMMQRVQKALASAGARDFANRPA
jgi:hypothetical protein